jgi:hypothetical protein
LCCSAGSSRSKASRVEANSVSPVILGHYLAVVADGGEDDEIGAGAERADLGHFRRAEAAREGKLALTADLLAAE